MAIKKVILNESSFGLLTELYQMYRNVYPLAKYIYGMVSTAIKNNSTSFGIDEETVYQYTGIEDLEIRVILEQNENEKNIFAYYDNGDLHLNLSAMQGWGEDQIMSKIAHELSHIYDEQQEYFDDDNSELLSSANNTRAIYALQQLSEYYRPKELNARANEAYSYYYNNLNGVIKILNNFLEYSEDRKLHSTDIIKQMFYETREITRIGEMREAISAFADDDVYKEDVMKNAITLCQNANYLPLNIDFRNQLYNFGCSLNKNANLTEDDKQKMKNYITTVFNFFKEKFNEFCRFLYWHFNELVKYTIETYYNNNNTENPEQSDEQTEQ